MAGKISAGTRYPKLYGRRWRKLRKTFLTENPLCVMCMDEGRVTSAEEVDHIEQHNGNKELFYDLDNLQPLCRFHHRTIKAEIERTGKVRGTRLDGTPLDPKNPWHQPRKF